MAGLLKLSTIFPTLVPVKWPNRIDRRLLKRDQGPRMAPTIQRPGGSAPPGGGARPGADKRVLARAAEDQLKSELVS